MKVAFAMILALGLSACASEREGGIANYDGLKQAQEKCASQGGKLTLKDGGNSEWLQDYSCKGK
jgi:uncharacterized lipoprotein YmbA